MRLTRRPPFPGMDPWLEHPSLWPNVHNSLITAIRDALAPRVSPRYFVGVEERVYKWTPERLALIGVPDVGVSRGRDARRPARRPQAERIDAGVVVLEADIPGVASITETYLQIVDLERHDVVTVIEVLSPSNKLHPRGRHEYLRKRRRIAETRTSLVEIDLMRAGRQLPLDPPAPPSPYRVLVRRPHAPGPRLYLFSYRTPIPNIPIPLRRGEPEVDLDLNGTAHGLFERACYHLAIDYNQPPAPPLPPEDLEWARAIIARAE